MVSNAKLCWLWTLAGRHQLQWEDQSPSILKLTFWFVLWQWVFIAAFGFCLRPQWAQGQRIKCDGTLLSCVTQASVGHYQCPGDRTLAAAIPCWRAPRLSLTRSVKYCPWEAAVGEGCRGSAARFLVQATLHQHFVFCAVTRYRKTINVDEFQTDGMTSRSG